MTENIYARIAKAYKIIAAQPFVKDGMVKGAASYKFIPIGQILEAVRKAQSEAGIVVVFGRPEYDHDNHEKRWEYVKEGNYGKTTWYAAVGHIEVTLYGSSADDCITVDVPFEAQDNSDKLTNKIITNAERCLYRTLYSIDEGSEDPEAINLPMEPEPKPQPKADPFFGKPAKAEPQPKADHTPKDSHETIAADRPRDVMEQAIAKAYANLNMRPIVKAQIQKVGTDDTERWTDAQVRECYLAIIEAGRGAQ